LEYIELNATVRTETGNGPARRLRAEGRCPAIFYGAKTEPVKLAVDAHAFEMSVKNIGAAAFFNLTIEGADGGKRLAMVKEVQREPVSSRLIHVDFYEVDLQQKLTVSVPVQTVGKSVGVEMGGLLQIIRRDLEVTCLPSNIPAFIEVDITEMNIGDSLHVEDIPLPDDVEIPHDVDFTVITVLSPKMEEEEEELEEGEEIEVGEEGEETAETTSTEE
jgi:large subunit ribosomal protein L25